MKFPELMVSYFEMSSIKTKLQLK